MRSLLPISAILLTASCALAQTTFQINTPSNVVVCEPILLQWTGGKSPYFLSSVLPGASPSGQALEDLGEQQGTSFTWLVNIAAGTSIGLTLRDSAGSTAQTAAFTINPGSNSSCVGQPLSSGGSSGTTANASTGSNSATTSPTTPATVPGTTATGGATTGVTTGATTGATTRTPTGTSTSASSTHTNAASANSVKIGAAGIVGAALLALLA